MKKPDKNIVPKYVSKPNGRVWKCTACEKACKTYCVSLNTGLQDCEDLIGRNKHFVPCDKDGREIKQ
jgi:hypothetical protein